MERRHADCEELHGVLFFFRQGNITAEGTMAKKKKWVQGVKTVSTFPPTGVFTKNAETIARTMVSKKVSPKGIGSGIRMIQFVINRAGKNLPPDRKRELEKAKQLLQEKGRKR
jgi:tRNA(adenine34) deaminase